MCAPLFEAGGQCAVAGYFPFFVNRTSARSSPRRGNPLASLIIIGLLCVVALTQSPALRRLVRKPIVAGEVEVFFSPNGGGTEAIVEELERAQKNVLVQAYSFTSARIAKALVDARKRGLDVQIIVDKSQRNERYTEADFTSHAGITTWIDAAHAIAHNKVMIIDGETVITGSFNFTKAAEEKNAENVLILRKLPALAGEYLDNWHAHQKHSEPYRK